MKFFEAVEIARKTGKKIKHVNSVDEARWINDRLVWQCGDTVLVYSHNLDADWQVIEPPPKQYTFAEAYEMMKAGKWMKVSCISQAYRYHNSAGWVWCKDIATNSMGLDFITFSPYMIESKWEEVNP